MLNLLSSPEIYSHAFLSEAYPDDEEKTSLRKGKERCSYDLSPVPYGQPRRPNHTIPSHPIQFPCSSKEQSIPPPPSQNKSPHLSRTNDNNKERKKERETMPIIPPSHCPKPINPPNPLDSKNPLLTPPILFPSLPPPSLPRAQVKVTDCLPAC